MRGYVIILNHKSFKSNEAERVGTEHDVLALTNLFEKFNIYYKIYKDLTFFQITSIVEDLKIFDFTNYSYLALIILSHGDVDNILCASDQHYNLTVNVVDPIVDNNPTLVDKPKIFIIQACKGKNSHICYSKNNDPSVCPPKITIPTKANICFAFSTCEGYSCERNIFIPSLCRHIDKYGTKDTIDVIMRNVTKEVIEKEHQVPMYISTLTEDFFFYDHDTRGTHPNKEQKIIIKNLSKCFMEQQHLKVKLKPKLIDDNINNYDASTQNQIKINHNILNNSQQKKDKIFRDLEEKLEIKKQKKTEQCFKYKLKPINLCDLTNNLNSIDQDSIIEDMPFGENELNTKLNKIIATNMNKEQLFSDLEDKLEKKIIFESNKEFIINKIKLRKFKELLKRN